MHYKNGREAKNGDKVVMITNGGKTVIGGFLYDAVAGNNGCNGRICVPSHSDHYANLSECLHVDDVNAVLSGSVPDTSKPAAAAATEAQA